MPKENKKEEKAKLERKDATLGFEKCLKENTEDRIMEELKSMRKVVDQVLERLHTVEGLLEAICEEQDSMDDSTDQEDQD